MKWKIWFTDGSSFDSSDGHPEQAPCKDVALMHVEDGRCGRRVLKFMDWYRWDNRAKRWFEGTEFDVLLHLTRNGYVVARRGGYMPEAEFQKILIEAHEDDFIPAISPGEPPHIAWKKG